MNSRRPAKHPGAVIVDAPTPHAIALLLEWAAGSPCRWRITPPLRSDVVREMEQRGWIERNEHDRARLRLTARAYRAHGRVQTALLAVNWEPEPEADAE